MNKKYKLVAICGKSAVGKDRLLDDLAESDMVEYHRQISHTSRPIRSEEKNGVEYNFVEKDYFKKNKEDFLEMIEFNNWYYGASINSLKEDELNIGIFTPGGIKELLKDDRIELHVVYMYLDDKERIIRSLRRDKNVDVNEVFRRYQADEEDFRELDLLLEQINGEYMITNCAYNDEIEEHINLSTIAMFLMDL